MIFDALYDFVDPFKDIFTDFYENTKNCNGIILNFHDHLIVYTNFQIIFMEIPTILTTTPASIFQYFSKGLHRVTLGLTPARNAKKISNFVKI